MRSTQAWLTSEHAQTNCFVDDPIISLKGTPEQRRMFASVALVVIIGAQTCLRERVVRV